MSLFSVIKHNARLALRGSWGKAIVALLVTAGASLLLGVLRTSAVNLFIDPSHLDPTFAIQYGFNEFFFQRFALATAKELVIYGVFALVGLALLAPLSLGVYRFYYHLVQGHQPGLADIFRYFEKSRRYRRALWFEVNMMVRVFLWSLLFFLVPGGIFAASLLVGAMGDLVSRTMLAMASVGLLLSAVLFLLAAVFFAVVVNRYVLASYLLAESDEVTVKEAIASSVAYTKGYRFNLLWFELSFIGWYLLCIFVFPMLYVAPYVNTSYAMYARYIIEKNRFVPPDPTREFDPAAATGEVPSHEPLVAGEEQPESPLPAEGDAEAETPAGGFSFPPSRYGVDEADANGQGEAE